MKHLTFQLYESARSFGTVLTMMLLLQLSVINCSGQQKPAENIGQDLKVFMARREIVPFHSKIMNLDFEIQIGFPVSYFTNEKLYPAIFCTDANRNMDLVTNIANIMSFPGQEIPEILTVGIGYPIKGMEDWGAWRYRDLTPTAVPGASERWRQTLISISGRKDLQVLSGGSESFLEFIGKELIPFIESKYRVIRKDHTLMGYSLGGLFTLYAMFKSPETFSRYFAGSPSIGWDNGILFQYEKEYSAAHNDLPVRLFMCVGSLDSQVTQENMQEMFELLNSRRYKGLRLSVQVFENETHTSCYGAGFSRAFRFLFGK